MTTAPTVTGPAQAPRPTSSIPQTSWAPPSKQPCSTRSFGATRPLRLAGPWLSLLPDRRDRHGGDGIRSGLSSEAMASASEGSGSVENQASSISEATGGLTSRRLSTRTLASFQRRAPRAVSASVHSAARTPATLLAAMEAPVPVQQQRTAVSVSPSATSSPTRRPTSAQPRSCPPGGPTRTTSWPRFRRSSATASVRVVRSSLPSAIRTLGTVTAVMAEPKVLTMVLAGGEGKRLAPLTADRAKPAVPFGGHYRIVDFALSNMANAGYLRIVVLTQYKSHSLDLHITRTWRLSTLLGSYVTPVPAQMRRGPRWFAGSADAIYQNLNLVVDEGAGVHPRLRRRPHLPDGPPPDGRAAHRHRRRGDGGRDPPAPDPRPTSSASSNRARAPRSPPSRRSRPTPRACATPPTRSSPPWATTSSPPRCWSTS